MVLYHTNIVGFITNNAYLKNTLFVSILIKNFSDFIVVYVQVVS